MKICIIGAGPTGLGAAWRLHEQGTTDFRLFEARDHVGGLATSYRDSAGYTWDFGVHVTHSHYHYFDKLLDTVLPDGYLQHERRSWIRQCGRYIPYPFQYNVRHLPREALWECIGGLLDLVNGQRPSKTPSNFEEWILAAFGDGIAKYFMFPYNRKIWSTDTRQMGYQWIGDRVPVTDVRRVIENVILERDDVAWGPNHTFSFPKTGGTGAIWNAMAARLPADTLHLSHKLVGIDVRKRELTFDNGHHEHYDRLISTLPIPELVRLSGDSGLIDAAQGLRHSHVQVLGVAPQHPMPETLKEKTWVYCPGLDCSFYRLTPFSAFSPAHVPNPDRQCSFLCETSFPPGETVNEKTLADLTLGGLVRGGFLDRADEDTHTYAMSAPYGYPVPTIDRDRILDRIQPALESLHIFSRGRFGAWKYEVANMDHCVMQGVEAADRILNGTPERTMSKPAEVNAGKS